MEKVQEQQSEEEEEFDPEYMDVQEEKVVSSHRSRGKKPAPIGQQQGGKTDEREGPKCGLGLTLKERSDGEYYIKRMEKGGPCEASGEVWLTPSPLFRDFLADCRKILWAFLTVVNSYFALRSRLVIS